MSHEVQLSPTALLPRLPAHRRRFGRAVTQAPPVAADHSSAATGHARDNPTPQKSGLSRHFSRISHGSSPTTDAPAPFLPVTPSARSRALSGDPFADDRASTCQGDADGPQAPDPVAAQRQDHERPRLAADLPCTCHPPCATCANTAGIPLTRPILHDMRVIFVGILAG